MVALRVAAAACACLLIAGCSTSPHQVSAGFQPESAVFVSPDTGWVVGLSTCGGASCLRLAATTDGAHSWHWVGGYELSGLAISAGWRLRFADARNGWISGPLLYATHDGGVTWRRIGLPHLGSGNAYVGALEAADGRVFAEVAEATDADTYGPVATFSSAVSSDNWSAVPNVATGSAGYPGEISVAEGGVWVMVHPGLVAPDHTVAVQSALYHSSDGITWGSVALPCPAESVASVAAASAQRVYVVCSGGVAGGSQLKTAFLSTDGGASYRRIGDPPLGGDFEEVAASSAALAVAAASGATFIYASFDDGRNWSTTSWPSGGVPLSDLRLITPAVGVAIFGDITYPRSLRLLMTHDGGLSWSETAVSPS